MLVIRRFLYAITPRSRGQTYLAYVGWLATFNTLHICLLAVAGLLVPSRLPAHLLVGSLTCLPFLMLALSMLKQHIVQQKRALRQARTDLLTGLPSRRAFVERVEAMLPASCLVVMVIDIDHFKTVNDTYGHGFGDDCLKQMAQNMRPVVSGSYQVGRLGGEEFGVAFPCDNIDRAREIGRYISRGVTMRKPGCRDRITITASVGATVASPTDTLSDLLNRADTALYRAKDQGRARMVMDTDPDPPVALIEMTA